MIQLAVAVATTILGLGPAIFLSAAAIAALPAGRAMDRFGRIPVIALGCIAGIVGTSTTALGCHWRSGVVVSIGFALVGASQGMVLLARGAAAGMVPPARRPRQISLVLFRAGA